MRSLFSNYIQKALPYFPILLLLLNVFSKSLYLTTDAISLDEPFSIYHAQFALPTILKQLANYNNPPLFEIVLHFWISLFGISPSAVRTLPALIACLCPLLLYYFAKRNFSIRVGVVSSLLLTFSNLLLFYSHDCRVYSLFVLLSLASFYYGIVKMLVYRFYETHLNKIDSLFYPRF
ncbi:MAG: glycosyltransferase family 39 protein [Bacteroidia bacterium]